MTDDELRDALIRHIKSNYKTAKDAASDWGCGTSFLCDVTKGRRPVPEWMLNKIGYERKIVRIDRC